MKVLILSFLLFSSSAFAESKSALQVFNELYETADVHNGSTNLTTYVLPFKMERELKEIKKQYTTDSNCKFEFTIGRRAAVKDIKSEKIQDEKTANELQKLINEKKIKTIISAQWDNQSGDSEYCSIYEFWVYDLKGNKLVLEFNFTD